MALKFHCDICGKYGELYPQTEPQWIKQEQVIQIPYTEEVPDPENPEKTTKVVKFKEERRVNKVPKMGIMKRQNYQTGEIEDIPVQETVDLAPRAYLVRLSIGHETVQRDFCKECLDKVLPEVQKLWDRLASIKGIE